MKKDKIQVEIEVLTPVHIGSNNEEMKSDIDFINFADDDCLAVIDIDKLFKRIHIDSAVHWESVIRK